MLLKANDSPEPRARMLARALMLTCLAMTAAAHAEDAPAWYTVELIVFENNHPRALESETWPESPGKPELQGAVELGGFLGAAELEDELGAGPHAFRLVDPSEHTLAKLAGRVSASLRFRPLLHIAWRQPGLSKGRAQAVHVSSELPNPYRLRSTHTTVDPGPVTALDGTSPQTGDSSAPVTGNKAYFLDQPSVDGVVRLYVTRYLHLVADLVYYRLSHEQSTEAGEASGQAMPGEVENPRLGDLYLGLPATPTQFRLNEHRRMRSRELHYFDHPLFGMLVQVTPYEPPQPPPQDTAGEAGGEVGSPETAQPEVKPDN